MKYSDVETAFLPPADARAAFERGDIDAWVIWDPFLADAEISANARIIADATGLAANREFFLSSKKLADEHPDVLEIIYEEIRETEEWVAENKGEAAEFLAPEIGMDLEVLTRTLERRPFGIEKVSEEVIIDQQKIADQFYGLKLIPKEIKVKDAAQ